MQPWMALHTVYCIRRAGRPATHADLTAGRPRDAHRPMAWPAVGRGAAATAVQRSHGLSQRRARHARAYRRGGGEANQRERAPPASRRQPKRPNGALVRLRAYCAADAPARARATGGVSLCENSRPEASAHSPSSTPRHPQSKLRAASSLGQPRPIGRCVLAGRPYRPCFLHRNLSARANHWAVRTCSWGRRRGRSCSPSLTSARAGWDRSRATDGASTAATRCTATATRTSRSSVCYSPPRWHRHGHGRLLEII